MGNTRRRLSLSSVSSGKSETNRRLPGPAPVSRGRRFRQPVLAAGRSAGVRSASRATAT